jgi:glyoxylase-like metal-dependent hydrolase (beta-lactamase superfamily II)
MRFEIFPVTRYRQNCSVLWCENTNRAAVIDPGGDLSEVLNFVDLMELDPELVVVTHGHFDHCGSAARLAEITGARIEGPHPADAALVTQLPAQTAFFAGLAAAKGVRTDGPSGSSAAVRSYVPARWLEHGDLVTFGNETLEVLHCPGHTGGHVAYVSRAQSLAFVGDILFRGTIGAWEHPQGNLAQLIDSIRYRLFPLGDDVEFVPGHGPMSTFGRERRDNPFVGDEAFARWLERFPEAAEPLPRD